VERLEALYASDDVVRQREAVISAIAPTSAERGVDIGCGTGLLAVELGRALGPGGEVLGVDSSARMVESTRRRAAAEAVPVRASLGDATSLPIADGWADFAVATQVLEYVPDVALALREAARVVRPGGRLLVLDTEWSSCVWEGDDRELVDRMLKAWRTHFAHPDLPRLLPQLLREAGFVDIRADGVPFTSLTLDEDGFSAGMLATIVSYLRSLPDVEHREVDRFAHDLRDRAERGAYYFSLTRSIFLASRPQLSAKCHP
jgi:arsenite methyltransferase